MMERDSWPKRAAVLMVGEVKITHAEGQYDPGALRKSNLFKPSLKKEESLVFGNIIYVIVVPHLQPITLFQCCLPVASCPILHKCKKKKRTALLWAQTQAFCAKCKLHL